jgi:hypothetical protein
MKRILSVAVIVGAFAAAPAQAASLYVMSHGNSAISIHLDGAPHNGNFDTVVFTARPGTELRVLLINAGTLVEEVVTGEVVGDDFSRHWRPSRRFDRLGGGHVAGMPRPPGQQYTDINRLLNSDPLDFEGGLNWSIVGLTRTPTEVSFTGGPLGGEISTADQPNGRLFLANLYIPIPEPPAAALASLAVLGLTSVQGRSRGFRE